jgi:hypothetical protein
MAPPVGAAQGESGATAPPAAEQPQDALPIELRRVKADLDDARSRLSELEEQIRLSSGGDPGAATGGDYRRAIQMFEGILEYAPDDPGVLAALQRAREGRYMTEERFRRVEIGMTQPEVREILGPAHIRNRRSYEEQAVQAWFYPRESDDHHAGVYFWQVAGQWQVYRLEYEIRDPGELNRD